MAGLIPWCLLFALGLLSLYRHITRNFNHWKCMKVPYLQPIPLFGNAFRVAIFKQSIGQFAKAVYEHADSKVIGFFMFDQPFLLIRDPEIIKDILIKNFEHFDNRSVIENRRDDEISSNMLFLIKNPAWKPLRTKLTPIFTSGKIKSMLPLMLEVGEDLKTFICEKDNIGGLIESREMCMKFTVDIISSCAFGINSHSFKSENAEFRVAARRMLTFTVRKGIEIGAYFVAPWMVNLFRIKFLDPIAMQFMRTVFLEHMHQRSTSNAIRGDLIDTLQQMKESKDTLDDEILVAQALQFFIAGFETTGNTISFALYELAINKQVQERLRKEVKEVMAKHENLTYEAIADMKYLHNVISETLRKYPALTFLDRRCSKQYQIPGTSVTIDEGIPIYISLFGLHMDPKHFPEPNRFDPDRFSEENKNSITPFTYLPFGEGPRNCIGARFGSVSAKIALITVVANFEVECYSRTPVPLEFSTTSGFLIAPKDGTIHLRFKKLVDS